MQTLLTYVSLRSRQGCARHCGVRAKARGPGGSRGGIRTRGQVQIPRSANGNSRGKKQVTKNKKSKTKKKS